MANPTTAKPSVAELDSSHPSYATVRCCVPIVAGEVIPRDIAGNVMGEPFAGYAYMQLGELPELQATGFNVSGLAEPAYNVRVGDSGFLFQGRGYTTAVYPRTIKVVVYIDEPACAANGGARLVCFGGPQSNYYFHGPAISVATDGTSTFGLYRAQAFFSSGLTLTAGWHCLAITITAASGTGSRLFFDYNYTTQTAQTSGADLNDSSGITIGTYNDACLNNGVGTALWNGGPTDTPFFGKIAYFEINDESFDPAVNPGRWQAFYEDPWAIARGTYTPSGSLTAGSVSAYSLPAGVRLAATRPSGGTAPYTIQWHRATVSGFTPGEGNALAGATSHQFLDTTAERGTTYWYKAIWTDSAGTPATVTSAQVFGNPIVATRRIGLIGSSSMAGQRFGRHLARGLRALGVYAGIANWARGGTFAYYGTDASLSWQPSDKQPGTTLLSAAMTAFTHAGVQDVFLQLGANDIQEGYSAESYATYIGNIVDALVAAGFRVLISSLTHVSKVEYYSEAKWDLVRQYQAVWQALDNGSTVIYLGNKNWQITSAMKRETHNDGLHPFNPDATDEVVAIAAASAMNDLIYDPPPTPAAVAAAVVANSTPPSPVWWIRADYGLYDSLLHAIDADATEVRQWRDKEYGANGFFWQNTTATAYPIYRAAGQNGKPYLSFDGVNDWLQGKHAGMLVDFDSYEVWFVVDPERTTTVGYLLGCGAVDGSDSPPNLCAVASDGYVGYQQHNPSSNWYSIGAATTGPQIIRYAFDAVAGTGKVYRDGVLLGSDYYLDAGAMNYVALCSRHDNTNYQMKCKVYEMRMFNQTLNTVQAASVLDDLLDYYGL